MTSYEDARKAEDSEDGEDDRGPEAREGCVDKNASRLKTLPSRAAPYRHASLKYRVELPSSTLNDASKGSQVPPASLANKPSLFTHYLSSVCIQ